MTSHSGNQNKRRLRRLPRSSIRNPSTNERQTVRFSSRIAHPEPLPSSLYLINDKKAALDSSERRSGGFGAPLYADCPRHHQRAIPSTIERQIGRFSSSFARQEASPVLPLAYKPEKSSSGSRGSPISAVLTRPSTPTAPPPSTRKSFENRTTNRPFFLPYRAPRGSPVLPQAYKPEKSSSGSRGSPIWRFWHALRRIPCSPPSTRNPSTMELQIVRFSSRIARSEVLPSFLKPARERRAALDPAVQRSGGSDIEAPSPPPPTLLTPCPRFTVRPQQTVREATTRDHGQSTTAAGAASTDVLSTR